MSKHPNHMQTHGIRGQRVRHARFARCASEHPWIMLKMGRLSAVNFNTFSTLPTSRDSTHICLGGAPQSLSPRYPLANDARLTDQLQTERPDESTMGVSLLSTHRK